ncbi:Serine/threonine-protein kinase gad8 [Trichoderma lentiforme]|uniref:Serine/threonine-protein kinase gad8 n=1 Tax=Trichoderma lentiforme TaxID=1567552 RepID=A0A9P4X751_9HYPO|nr:Serine/threonine-protein kinase gad8 [Trichoderma lentiforme]
MAHNLISAKDETSSLTNEDIFASSQYVSTSHPPNQPWPGILTVRIFHGNGFSIPDQYHQAVNSVQSGSSLTQTEISKRPWLNLNGRRLLLLYAIVEYDKFYARSLSASEIIEKLRWENLGSYSVKFDVFRAAELVLRFYLYHPSHRKGSSDFFLGKARIEPVLEERKYTRWLQVEEGAGEVCVEIEYTKTATPGIQAVGGHQGRCLGESCSSGYRRIFQVEKRDTNLLYASKKLVDADDSSHVFLSQADKPFVAPLGFVAPIPEGLQLHAPLIHGGPLFYHLQKPRRFDVDRCQFYAAEILCAFESLLSSNPSYRGPKTENILLDSIGHVVLCDFSLYHLDTAIPSHSTVEYPAPEQLLHENSSTKTSVRWWWTLGIFLYEMLTGVPPFYSESIEKIHEKITSSEPIVYPNYLPSSAKDILAGLLDRNPERRLGAKRGASEIKEHPFFDCIDWNKLMRREYHPDFKPPKVTMRFTESRKVRALAKAEAMKQLTKGSNYVSSLPTGQITRPATVDHNKKFMEMMQGKFPVAAASLPPPPPPRPFPDVKIPIDDNRDWELVWDEEAKVFYFYNRSNNARQIIVPQTSFPRQTSSQAHDGSSTGDVGNLPSQIQKEDALEAALKAGYTHLISQILHKYGGMDLNVKLYGFQRAPTLLEFAVEQEDANLLQLFIDGGATDTSGNALFLSVKKGYQELVAILAKMADRVDLTRALGRAVDRKDAAAINILLASGAKCDFKESDRPPPPSRGCYFPDVPDNEDYMPPLVRAVRLDNMELVRLLLANGADVNVGYHDLRGEHRSRQVIDVMCGRVIEAAMELGHRDMVELFLEMGADIHLPQPTWQFHDCPVIARSVYFSVRTQLREVEAAWQSTRDSAEWVVV